MIDLDNATVLDSKEVEESASSKDSVLSSSARLALDDYESALDKKIPTLSLSLSRSQAPIPFENTVWIAQQEVGFCDRVEDPQFMGSPYFRNCSAVSLWSPESQLSALFHVSNKTNVYDVASVVRKITKDGKWQISMAGGSEYGVRQEIYGGKRYNWLLAEMLNNIALERETVTFGFQRPSGEPAGCESDKTYLLNRETGELFSVDNNQVAEVEFSAPERLGPNFTERFNAANLFPYFSVEAPPCIVAYCDGEYTGDSPQSTPGLDLLLQRLRIDYFSLREQKLENDTRIAELPEDLKIRMFGSEFVSLLRKHIPGNLYLIERCEREEMMRSYMQELLLIHWSEMAEHPIVAS